MSYEFIGKWGDNQIDDIITMHYSDGQPDRKVIITAKRPYNRKQFHNRPVGKDYPCLYTAVFLDENDLTYFAKLSQLVNSM